MRIFVVFSILAMLAACGPITPTADQIQNRQQERLDKQAVQSVGMPAITHFFEKRQLKTIYELRDQAISTITYLTDRYGKLHKLCESIGYGIPYATQYTSPQHIADSYESGYAILPQADPNGLFSPADAAGTWVLCVDPKSHQTSPVYAEPNVLVSRFPLQTQ